MQVAEIDPLPLRVDEALVVLALLRVLVPQTHRAHVAQQMKARTDAGAAFDDEAVAVERVGDLLFEYRPAERVLRERRIGVGHRCGV